MEIINFLIGQLVGLVEPFLAIDFIIKCLGWKEGVRHRKQLYIGVYHNEQAEGILRKLRKSQEENPFEHRRRRILNDKKYESSKGQKNG